MLDLCKTISLDLHSVYVIPLFSHPWYPRVVYSTLELPSPTLYLTLVSICFAQPPGSDVRLSITSSSIVGWDSLAPSAKAEGRESHHKDMVL